MKQKQVLFILVGATVLMLGGQLSTPIQRTSLQEQIAEKQRRGYSVKFLDNTLVELTEPMTGAKRLKSLLEPSEGEIRAWAAARGVPILEIDPSAIDTTQYDSWYRFWTRVPGSTPANDFPVIADVDHDGLIENYGVTNDTVFPYNGYMQIYEVDTNGVSVLRHTYPPPPFPAIASNVTDIDRNGLSEFCIANANLHTMKFFEQAAPTQLPTNLRFTYIATNTVGGDPTTTPYFGSLDGDNKTDCLHIISEPDSDSLGRTYFKITVAEFDSSMNNLRRVWSSPVPPRSDLGFYTIQCAVGDFDGAGKMEFATTTGITRPTFFIFEDGGDNSYRLVFQDTIPGVTNYTYIGSGDIDGDAKDEIFSCATISTGNWTFVHEADSNDHYSLKSIIHIFAGGTFDSPSYFSKDMDGDGKLELVFTAGQYLLMLKGDGDNRYRVALVKRLPGQENILLSDFNHDGLIDFAVGKYERVPPATQSTHFTDLYLRVGTSGVQSEENHQMSTLFIESYPNPFNPNTTLRYQVIERSNVQLMLFDSQGRLVRKLLDNMQEPGSYEFVLDGTSLSSGVYLCQLRSGTRSVTRKIILLR
jgi:hypothetical protein